MTHKKSILVLVMIMIRFSALAQLTQSVRGTVTDPVLGRPVKGATVSMRSLGRTSVTDSTGSFRFNEVPVGTQALEVSHIGFKDLVMNRVVVTSGKELVLNIPLEPGILVEKEVVVKSDSKKNKPINEMSAVSARAFTV